MPRSIPHLASAPLHERRLHDPGGNLTDVHARLTDAELAELPDDKEPVSLVEGR